MPSNRMTVFEARAISMRYVTLKEFRAGAPQAYFFLNNNKLTREVAHHLVRESGLWDRASVLLEASKHLKRNKFYEDSRAAYIYAYRHGFLDEACAHMRIDPRYSYKRWTTAEVFLEAGKYATRAEFKRCNAGAYEFALAGGHLDQACCHMRDGNNFWHVFELMAVAIKYTHWAEFRKLEPRAYEFVNGNKLHAIASAHMQKSRRDWDKPAVMAEAAKHQQRGLFQAVAAGAYKHADKYGYLDEACAHMPAPEYGFSKERPGVLYHLRITTAAGTILYKLGITNRAVERRIASMGLHRGCTVEILNAITFDSGRDARIAEKRLHRRHSCHRYNGPSIMGNGNTELFLVPLIDI